MIRQKEISLPAMRKGFHKIDHIVHEAVGPLPEAGLINIFVKHTSAALMLNENADPDVQADLHALLEKMAPRNAPFYKHTLEGPDDMPAHFKSAVLGPSVTIPLSNHRLNLGVWQSLYFCEFRNYGGGRTIVVTLYF
ncbi:MAG: secondary thiamine-phosphate synthase enzyme YjbQ [Bacteroidales bacterium]|nr:secondary thiamine-phosphate synthase enzyme YjbQ [Bacteroidales bacterium]